MTDLINVATMPQDYWAWMESGDLKPLGICEDFDEADERATKLGTVIYIFSRQGLNEFMAEARREIPTPVTEVGGWLISTSDDPDNQYLYVERDGAPGQIHIKAEDEGFVVDIWPTDTGDGNSTYNGSVASCAATYPELEPE